MFCHLKTMLCIQCEFYLLAFGTLLVKLSLERSTRLVNIILFFILLLIHFSPIA